MSLFKNREIAELQAKVERLQEQNISMAQTIADFKETLTEELHKYIAELLDSTANEAAEQMTKLWGESFDKVMGYSPYRNTEVKNVGAK